MCNRAGKKADHIELPELIQWLNDHQRDPRLNEILAPPFDEKRASAIIANYESCAKNCKNSKLFFYLLVFYKPNCNF